MAFDYKDIDEILSGRLRLAIVAFLLTAKQAEFSELVKATYGDEFISNSARQVSL